LDTITSDDTPDISYLMNLPMHILVWAIYALVLEKRGERPRVYIRIGTSAVGGVKVRMDCYDRRSKDPNATSGIPYYVEKSMQEGFTISTKGLLAWTTIPRASEVWTLRCLTLVMEATFSMCFWTMKSRTKDYCMPALCPWPIESLDYDGLCSHWSINEGIAGTPTSGPPEEINALVEERRKSKQAQYIANKGPGVHAANTKAYGDKALEEQRYRCEVCDLAFRFEARLNEHMETQAHWDKVAGIGRRTAGCGGGQRAIEARRFWCEVCQHAVPSAKRLATHLISKYHLKKLRDLACEGQARPILTPPGFQAFSFCHCTHF
jgi:hypothetical protein